MAEITSKLASMTKSAAQATGDFVKTTKLNMARAGEQSTLKNLYQEIGEKVHEIYRYGGSLGALFDKYYQDILASEKRTAELEAQIAEIKGIRDCPACGKPVERGVAYCPQCGTGMAAPEIMPAEAVPAEAAAVLPAAAPAVPPAVPAAQFPPPPLPDAPPLPAPAAPAAPASKTCRVCNTANAAGTKFCLSCGRIVD